MESSVHPSVDFFLGATTPAGFKGYFAPLRREPGMQLVLLKSGPGCGKSTLMKRLARAAQDKGEPIQRIHCASDPDSLDGVVFLRQKRAIIDATAPHVVEPEAPGADERVLSLYHTIDADALHPHKDEVTALFARNQLLRSRAARYVASAGSLQAVSKSARRSGAVRHCRRGFAHWLGLGWPYRHRHRHFRFCCGNGSANRLPHHAL